MLKFRFILLLSVALMSSGYRWRCYAFCDEQTAIQNDYTEQRDDCRGFAQDNIDAEMAKAPNPNSVKARKIKLIALFSDCMAQYGWDVPKVNDKGGKLADSGEVPLYTSTVSKLAASEKNPDAEVPNTPAPVEGEITEQDLPARKTPVGNIPKQQEIKQQENLKQENSKNTNNTNTVVQKSAKSKAQSGKSQSATQTDNIQNQPATTKSKKSVKTSKEQNDQKPADNQVKSSSQKTTSTTSSTTTNKVIEKPASEQQSTQPIPIPPPPPANSTSYRKVTNNNNSLSQPTDNKAGNNSHPPIQKLSPEAGRYEPPATISTTSEPIKNSPNPTYTKEANSVNNMPANSSVYTDQTTSDDMRQPTLSANRAQIVSSSNSESTNQIIKEKESIERITSSQQSDNVSNATTVTTATAPPAAAGVLLPGIDESAIPSQPRVTKNNSATQKTSECEYARRSAGVSEAAAKKAKECDIECAKQRKVLPKTVTPPACPIKDPAVNLLDTQLGNKP